jgi:fructose-specific phosphotransferase system IIC component
MNIRTADRIVIASMLCFAMIVGCLASFGERLESLAGIYGVIVFPIFLTALVPLLWMMWDVVVRPEVKNRGFWVLAFFIGSIVAAYFYYYLVYRRADANNSGE